MNSSVQKLVVVALMTCLPATYAQQSQQSNKQRKPPIATKPIVTPEALPDVPPYSGQARYISGETVQTSGENLRQTWHVREPKSEVINWYKQALSGAGWTITSASRGSVMGKKKDSVVMIVVNEIPLADHYRSEIMIQYSRN